MQGFSAFFVLIVATRSVDMARTIRLGEGFPAVDGSVERSVSRTISWERASLRPIAAWHAVGGTWTQ
jgi:hypothetical protein